MKTDTPWQYSRNETQSLTVCLKNLLAWHGQLRPDEEISALLGLGALFVAYPGENCNTWPQYAHDVGLNETASLYGIQLRALHPPTAAIALGHAPAFADHYHDSYQPLIESAVAAQLPCLVWHGWPSPNKDQWGILTAIQDKQLVGHTLASTLTPFVGPAWQAYVIEAVDPKPITDKQLFDHAIAIAERLWDSQTLVCQELKFGQAGYETWNTAIDEANIDPKMLHCQGTIVRHLVTTRSRQSLWLRQIAVDLDRARRAKAYHWAEICDRIASRLSNYSDEADLQKLLATDAGRDDFRNLVSATRGDETSFFSDLRHAST